MYIIKLEGVKNNSPEINIKEGDCISIGLCNGTNNSDFFLLGSCNLMEEALCMVENICQANGFSAEWMSGYRGFSRYRIIKT